MKLLDELNLNKGNRNEEIAYLLKKSNRPIVLYGAGVYAQLVFEFLTQYGVDIDDVIVDKEFFAPGMRFNNILIKDIEQLQFEQRTYNIIIGIMPEGIRYETMHKEVSTWARNSEIFFLELIRENFNLEDMSKSFVLSNSEKFNETYNYLEDQLSRETFIAYLNQCMWRDVRYLDEVVVNKQYYPEIIKFTKGEVFVDCGAYDGDTITTFIEQMQEEDLTYGKIIAFEPDERNFKKLQQLYDGNNKCQLIDKGVYKERDTLKFIKNANTSSSISEEGEEIIEVESIDNVMNGDKATYIKMDIEGSELAALRGAKDTICKYKPKLAICIYHKREDLMEIPQFIKSLVPEYKLYLRAYSSAAVEIVLYATL